jgi:hypothetical protein
LPLFYIFFNLLTPKLAHMPVIPQGVAEVPDFLDEGAAVHFDSSIGALTQPCPIARLPGGEHESQPARNGGQK